MSKQRQIHRPPPSPTTHNIFAIGDGGAAIKTTGDATVSNNLGGEIAGGAFGIDATNANITNNGRIFGGLAGATAIHATGTATVSNTGDGTNTGVIQGVARGIDAGTVIVTSNTGRIEAVGANAVAINAATDADVTNAGTIRANGSLGVAINSLNTAKVSNSNLIQGSLIGIEGQTVNVTSNSGTIESTATNSVAILAGVGGVTVNNSGTIQSNGTAGIFSGANADITSSGTIQANVSGGHAIDAATATVNNSGTITANGIDGVAVFTLGATDVVNSGIIQASGAFRSAVVSVNGAVTANNSTSGVITGGSNGVIANNNTVDVVNAGLIETTVSDGTAISGRTATVNNNTSHCSRWIDEPCRD